MKPINQVKLIKLLIETQKKKKEKKNFQNFFIPPDAVKCVKS